MVRMVRLLLIHFVQRLPKFWQWIRMVVVVVVVAGVVLEMVPMRNE